MSSPDLGVATAVRCDDLLGVSEEELARFVGFTIYSSHPSEPAISPTGD